MESSPRIIVPPAPESAGPTPPPVAAPTPENERTGGLLPLVMIGGVALLSFGAIGYALGQRSGDSGEAAVELGVLAEPTTTVAPATTAVPATTAAPATTASPATTVPATAAPTTQPPTTTAAPAELAGPPLRDTGTVRQAVLEGGVLYLRGRVPSAEFGEQVAAQAELVVGPGNVINQYQVDADAAPVDSAPLYVADTVLFPTGGVVINPAFIPLLDLGTKLLSVNENVTITVVAHTDSAGSAGLNQRLSQARAETVKQYWVDQGADAGRITAIGRGESDPIGDNSTAEGKQINRRAEFIVTGILG